VARLTPAARHLQNAAHEGRQVIWHLRSDKSSVGHAPLLFGELRTGVREIILRVDTRKNKKRFSKSAQNGKGGCSTKEQENKKSGLNCRP